MYQAVWVAVLALSATGLLAEDRVFTWEDENAMDRYVHRDDGWFSWRIVSEIRYENASVTLYNVNMTSQKWMDESYTTRSIWWHVMGVAIPDVIRYPDAGVLVVAGGNNDDAVFGGHFDPFNLIAMKFAQDCGCVAGYVKQVPNQRMRFTNDPDNRSKREDRIIAWTWKTYLDSEDPSPGVVLRMPMTKAGKRGLDALHEIAKFKRPETDVKRFAVTGASKRGWTTWSVAATDQRVVCMFPIVFSVLLWKETMVEHWQALGGAWSWAVKDYWDVGLTANVFNPKMHGIFDYEDMIRYTPRFTIPKVMVAAVGDEYMANTDSHLWWDKMPGPKYILMVANAEHTLFPHYSKIYNTVMGVWLSVLQNEPLPSVTWQRRETGSGLFTTGHVDMYFDDNFLPKSVTGCSGDTGLKLHNRRDFRYLVASNAPCGSGTDNGSCDTEPHLIVWRRDNVTEVNSSHVSFSQGRAARPGSYKGMMIEAEFDGPEGFTMSFTTEVQMIPDSFPVGACTKDPDCHSYLV